MTSYAEFLERKRRVVADHGRHVDSDQLHPNLFEWQAAVTSWAIRKGRAAVFADCGMGKTFIATSWPQARAGTSLTLAPLSVARQTVREAAKLDIEARYVRSQGEVTGPGVWVTNYEMLHRFDPRAFGAVVLDESSILKNADGKLRRYLTMALAAIERRLACTATPAPNDVTELCNHAEFLGAMQRPEMLAQFFVNDEFHGRSRWRLKGHAGEAFYAWMASWAVALRRPSDLGWPDDGYELPELRIHPAIVEADVAPVDGQLFAVLGGVGGRSKVRKATATARVERAAELAAAPGQWVVWCGLNQEATEATRAIDGAVNVEGSMNPDAKAEALEAFQDGDIRVLVSKPSICGFGMNFQQAHQMVFLGLSDSYEAYYQAIRRCWRFGQQHPVDVHIVVSDLEREIVENVRAKEATTSEFTDGLVRHSQVRRAA